MWKEGEISTGTSEGSPSAVPQGLALAAQPRQKAFCHYLFCKHFPLLKAFQGGKELVMCFLWCSWEGPQDMSLIRDRKKE